MRRKLIYLWGACLAIGIVLLVYIGIRFQVNQVAAESVLSQPVAFTGWTQQTVDEHTIRYTNNLPHRTLLGRDYLGFYTVHQEVAITSGNERIYTFSLKDSPFGHTPGSAWHIIPMPNLSKQQPITIELKNVYPQTKTEAPDIYLGHEMSFYVMLIAQNGFSYLLCFITFLCGLAFLTYQLYMHKQIPENKSLLFLGAFTILLSIWSGNENPLTLLIFQNDISLSYLAYISLLLMPMPLLLFTQSLVHKQKQHPLWNTAYLLSIASFLLCTLFQVFNIADFRQLLFLIHIDILSCSVIMTFLLIQEIRSRQINTLLRKNLTCFLIFVAFFCMDLLNYYRLNGRDSSTFTRLGFLIYVLIMGCSILANTRELVRKGQEQEIYKQLAYHDQLSGLFNRAAFERDFAQLQKENTSPAIVMLDLNNLKRCNDTLGHAAGDHYIYQSAQALKKAFGKLGACYRIGGDEFCVLIQNTSAQNYKAAEQILQQEISSLQKNYPNLNINIAHGFAAYTKELDGSLMDMKNRADKNMYDNKQALKNQEHKKDS